VRATVGTVVATQASSAAVVPAGRTRGVSADDEIATGVDSRARLDLPGGVAVEVGSASKVTVRRARPLDGRLELLLGRVAVDVPPSGPRRSFVVVTPDAEVAVHGTAFVVEVQRHKSNATVTSVTVSRGEVLVTQGASRTLLSAGRRWSSARPDEGGNVSVAEPRAGSPEGEQAQTISANATQGEAQQAKTFRKTEGRIGPQGRGRA
jgi:ferric-dicitrate binding protein FerR (iron transport regulator)